MVLDRFGHEPARGCKTEYVSYESDSFTDTVKNDSTRSVATEAFRVENRVVRHTMRGRMGLLNDPDRLPHTCVVRCSHHFDISSGDALPAPKVASWKVPDSLSWVTRACSGVLGYVDLNALPQLQPHSRLSPKLCYSVLSLNVPNYIGCGDSRECVNQSR